MAKSKPKPKGDQRNRNAIAKAKGRHLLGLSVSGECRDAILHTAKVLSQTLGVGTVTQTQALEWLVAEGKKSLEKSSPGIDKD